MVFNFSAFKFNGLFLQRQSGQEGYTFQEARLIHKHLQVLLISFRIHYQTNYAMKIPLLNISFIQSLPSQLFQHHNIIMSTPFVFSFNLRRSVFEQFGLSMFNQISKLQMQSGSILLLPIVNGLADGVYARAQAIKRQLPLLLEEHKIQKCHLISYSLSGIDARYAISNLGLSNYTKSLTTLATPHLGCRLAWLSERQVISDKRSQPIARLLGVGLRPFWEVTPQNMLHFNQRIKNVASVRYFSIGAQRLPNNMNTHLRESGNYLRQRTEANFVYENDGVVGHDQCQWGDYLVNFEADHTQIAGINPNPQLKSIFTLIEDNALHEVEQQQI